MLDATNLGFRFGDRWLWRGLNLSIAPGDIVGILGRNGTGKTTLLRTLGGIRMPSEGVVRVGQGIGYVPQVTEISFPFTVRQVVSMGRSRHIKLLDGFTSRDEVAVDAAIDQVGVRGIEDRSFLQLSGGEKQLVLMARAICSDAQILLLDEPMASLDLDNQQRLMALMTSLSAGAKLGIVFVTHNPDHVFAVSNKSLLIRENHPITFGAVEQVLTEDALTELYGLPVRLITLDHGSGRTRHAIPLF